MPGPTRWREVRPDRLVLLVSRLDNRCMPDGDLTPDQRTLLACLGQLRAEIATPAPEPSRVRKLGQAVLDSVTRALPEAALARAPVIAAGILDVGRGLFG
jgi:hypothetical protein